MYVLFVDHHGSSLYGRRAEGLSVDIDYFDHLGTGVTPGVGVPPGIGCPFPFRFATGWCQSHEQDQNKHHGAYHCS